MTRRTFAGRSRSQREFNPVRNNEVDLSLRLPVFLHRFLVIFVHQQLDFIFFFQVILVIIFILVIFGIRLSLQVVCGKYTFLVYSAAIIIVLDISRSFLFAQVGTFFLSRLNGLALLDAPLVVDWDALTERILVLCLLSELLHVFWSYNGHYLAVFALFQNLFLYYFEILPLQHFLYVLFALILKLLNLVFVHLE